MGVVYRAIDPVLKRSVSIKVMSDAFAQNEDLRERFLREAQAAGSLQHPNVITIYDFGEVDGHPYIAMEFVEGQDVAELLAHQVPLTLTNKLDLAIGVLQGLAFAHKRGIIHRDIKPANIRVDEEGKARVMDFGVAHLASSDMTRSGVMLGTPSYMAPEQILGGKVGPQTDIFSVGAVLYELLTGARPFEGGTLQAVMYRVLSEKPAPLDRAAPGLPAKLNDVVMRALAKDPDMRYPSALDMANDLIAIRAAVDASPASLGTLSLRATIESALEGRRTREFQRVRRRRIGLTGAGVAAAAGLVLVGWFLARRGMTTNESRLDAVSSSAPSSTASPILAGAAAAPTREQPTSGSDLSPAPSQTQTQGRRPAAPANGGTDRVAERLGDRQRTPRVEQSRSTAAPPVTRMQEQAAAPAIPPAASSSPPPPANPVVTQQPVASPPAPDVRPIATPTVSTAANASAEIASVIEAYARAIESRDITELRRVYAAISTDQERAFSDFFASTRTLRATLSVRSVQVDGAGATARVAGIYEFTTTAGRTQQQPVSFEAELRRDATTWKLVTVR